MRRPGKPGNVPGPMAPRLEARKDQPAGAYLSLPNSPSALFYKHLRLLSAMLFAAAIEALQPERTASPWA